MSEYREIEDPARLEALSRLLAARMKRQLRFSADKIVGYPSGRSEFPVNFELKRGADVRWWSSTLSDNKEAYINLIGRGDPDSNAYLLIDLQFNVPVKKFARAHGGAFVEDIESKDVVLAHRGIVTRGKSRVKREVLFRCTTAKTTSVLTSKGSVELFLVASLESPQLLEDIADFSEEIRRAAEVATGTNGREATFPLLTPVPEVDRKLNAYFDEFCGPRRLPRREAVIVEVRHGKVVSSLVQAMAGVGEALKSQLVDLAIKSRRQVLLFEVKTSVAPVSLYTAIGQLSLHSAVLQEQYTGYHVRRIMVLPAGPAAETRRRIEQSLGIEVLTFTWQGSGGVAFDSAGLEKIRN